MSFATEVCVWFPTMKLDALKTELKTRNISVEDALLVKLEELYEQTVPEDRRAEIDTALSEQDRLTAEKEARRKAEQYRVGAICVCKDGWCECWKIERVVDIVYLARTLRRILRDGEADLATMLMSHFPDRQVVPRKEYDELTAARFSGDIHVSGVYALDLDRLTLTAADVESRGWKTWKFCDISTAIYQADRKQHLSWKETLYRFENALSDRDCAFRLWEA